MDPGDRANREGTAQLAEDQLARLLRLATEQEGDPRQAFDDVLSLWSRVDRLAGFAEASARVARGRVCGAPDFAPIALAEDPAWLRQACEDLMRTEEIPMLTVACAGVLVRACLTTPAYKRVADAGFTQALHPMTTEIKSTQEQICTGDVVLRLFHHTESVSVASDLTWCVRAPEMSMPVVHVVSMRRHRDGRRETSTIRDAGVLVRQFVEVAQELVPVP